MCISIDIRIYAYVQNVGQISLSYTMGRVFSMVRLDIVCKHLVLNISCVSYISCLSQYILWDIFLSLEDECYWWENLIHGCVVVRVQSVRMGLLAWKRRWMCETLLTLSRHLFYIVIFLLYLIYSKVFYFLHSGEPKQC